MTNTPKAGDALILPDGETRALIQETFEGFVVLSRLVEPVPTANLVPVPGEKDLWRLAEGSAAVKQ
jgi:hypothetical protein